MIETARQEMAKEPPYKMPIRIIRNSDSSFISKAEHLFSGKEIIGLLAERTQDPIYEGVNQQTVNLQAIESKTVQDYFEKQSAYILPNELNSKHFSYCLKTLNVGKDPEKWSQEELKEAVEFLKEGTYTFSYPDALHPHTYNKVELQLTKEEITQYLLSVVKFTDSSTVAFAENLRNTQQLPTDIPLTICEKLPHQGGKPEDYHCEMDSLERYLNERHAHYTNVAQKSEESDTQTISSQPSNKSKKKYTKKKGKPNRSLLGKICSQKRIRYVRELGQALAGIFIVSIPIALLCLSIIAKKTFWGAVSLFLSTITFMGTSYWWGEWSLKAEREEISSWFGFDIIDPIFVRLTRRHPDGEEWHKARVKNGEDWQKIVEFIKKNCTNFSSKNKIYKGERMLYGESVYMTIYMDSRTIYYEEYSYGVTDGPTTDWEFRPYTPRK